MPVFTKALLTLFIYTAISSWYLIQAPDSQANEGIDTYYIRYDVKSSKNKMFSDNLLMIPERRDFRAENFSLHSVSGVISADRIRDNNGIDKAIKEDALKSLLVSHGLKSLSARDQDTVVSYEGAVITPILIKKKDFNQDLNQYNYTVQVQFSPIGFPDQWENMGIKNSFKRIIFGLFDLFK